MNKERRRKIEKAAAILTEVRDDEQLARDNLPEGIYDSEKADKMDEAVYQLDDALGNLAEIDGVEIDN
jgi:hypothetical protein